MLASSYFLNRIKYISQNSNFRRDTILRNGLLVDWGGGATTSRGRGEGGWAEGGWRAKKQVKYWIASVALCLSQKT